MTLQELSKYYDIQMTLEKDREALENLRQKINPASPQLTGMPHTPGVRDKVADLAVELAEGRGVLQEHHGCPALSDLPAAVCPLLLVGRSCWSTRKVLHGSRGQPDGLQLPRITLTDKPCICGAFYFCPKNSNLTSNYHKIRPNIEMSFTFWLPKVKFKLKISKVNADCFTR